MLAGRETGSAPTPVASAVPLPAIASAASSIAATLGPKEAPTSGRRTVGSRGKLRTRFSRVAKRTRQRGGLAENH
jgi:hypothetical protein